MKTSNEVRRLLGGRHKLSNRLTVICTYENGCVLKVNGKDYPPHPYIGMPGPGGGMAGGTIKFTGPKLVVHNHNQGAGSAT